MKFKYKENDYSVIPKELIGVWCIIKKVNKL